MHIWGARATLHPQQRREKYFRHSVSEFVFIFTVGCLTLYLSVAPFRYSNSKRIPLGCSTPAALAFDTQCMLELQGRNQPLAID